MCNKYREVRDFSREVIPLTHSDSWHLGFMINSLWDDKAKASCTLCYMGYRCNVKGPFKCDHNWVKVQIKMSPILDQ